MKEFAHFDFNLFQRPHIIRVHLNVAPRNDAMFDSSEGHDPSDDIDNKALAANFTAPQEDSRIKAKQNGSGNGGVSTKQIARELHWLEKLNIFGQMGLVVVGIIAASIYGCQLHQMKRTNDLTQQALNSNLVSLNQTLAKMQKQVDAADAANKLTRQSLSGTEGAFIVAPPRLAVDQNQVVISFMNAGKVPARNVEATIQLSKQSLPDYKRIGPIQNFTLNAEVIHPGSIEVKRRLTFNGFSKVDWDRVTQGLETITVQGNIHYDNGFGILLNESFCNSQMYLRFPDGHTGGGGWMDCGDVIEATVSTIPYDQRKPW